MAKQIIERPMPEQCTMATYEAIADNDLVQYRDYTISDYPSDGANAEQMAYALTCKRLFPEGTIIMFSGETDDIYTKGHCYQIKTVDENKTWVDITPAGAVVVDVTLETAITDDEWDKLLNAEIAYVRVAEGSGRKNLYIKTWEQEASGEINLLVFGGTYSSSTGNGSAYRRLASITIFKSNKIPASDYTYIPRLEIPYLPSPYGLIRYDHSTNTFETVKSTNIPTKQQTYFVTELPTTDTPYVEHDLAVVNNQTVYALEKVNDVLTWVKKYNVGDSGQIKTITYDNTTLGDHIADILQYVNVENGGTLLSIGFKTGTASVAATATKTTITNGANPTVATSSEAVLKPATFYSFRSADINKTGNVTMLTLNGPNGLTDCSSTNIEITSDSSTETPTNTCVANGCGQSINADGAVEIITFKGVNLLSIPLEHLVIDYFEV